jgi:chaperonin cofactor prefoldin
VTEHMVVANAALTTHGMRLELLTRDVGLLRQDVTVLRRGQEELNVRLDTLQTGYDTLQARYDTLQAGQDALQARYDTLHAGARR